MQRAGRGTLRPTQAARNLGFAGDYDGGGYGMGCSCGATRDDGTTASRYHTSGCELGALSGDEQAAAYRTSGIYDEIAQAPFEDANGRTFHDQNGYAMTLTDHFESLTGQRVTREPFNGLARPELSVPQRGYNDGIRALAAELGLGDHRAAREEKRDRAFDHMVQRPAVRYRTYGEAMDYGVPVRQRESAETQLQFSNHGHDYGDGKVLRGWDDGCELPGELVGLTYG